MSKSQKTYWMEEIITLATWKVGQIGCAEVGLGDEGIVDYITQELGGDRTIRCYELKITKSDFLSDAKKTFIGDYNFYVYCYKNGSRTFLPTLENTLEMGNF